jgi:hypothetical protein
MAALLDARGFGSWACGERIRALETESPPTD